VETALQRLRSGSWLTRRLVVFAGSAGLACTAASLLWLFAMASGTVDAAGRPLGTDFSSFWSAGKLALAGAAPAAYDWATLQAFQEKTHGVDLFYPWSYPPLFLAVAALIATMPYVPALLLWQATSLAAALAALRAISGAPPFLLAGLGCPIVLVCLGHGQTGFLTAALLTGGVLCLPRREALAGVLFGLLAYKPQFGLLIPLVLIAGGHWRAFAAAGATVLAGIGLTLALWGWPVWQAFLDSLALTRTIVFEAGDTGFEKFQSVFAWLRLWGAPTSAAYLGQAIATAAAAAGCLWAWRREVGSRLKGAALLVATLLSTPYVLDYDLIVLGMALALLAAHGLEHGFRPWEKTILALAWLLPTGGRGLAMLLPLPVGFVALAGVFALILARVRAASRSEGRAYRGALRAA
jgi:Glycosyltransferase family 87